MEIIWTQSLAQKRDNLMEMVLVTHKCKFSAKIWPVSPIEILSLFASKVLYDCQFDQRSGKMTTILP